MIRLVVSNEAKDIMISKETQRRRKHWVDTSSRCSQLERELSLLSRKRGHVSAIMLGRK